MSTGGLAKAGTSVRGDGGAASAPGRGTTTRAVTDRRGVRNEEPVGGGDAFGGSPGVLRGRVAESAPGEMQGGFGVG